MLDVGLTKSLNCRFNVVLFLPNIQHQASNIKNPPLKTRFQTQIQALKTMCQRAN
jgi:hypothetical protein